MSWDSVWKKLEALLASPGFRPSPPAYAGISLAAFDNTYLSNSDILSITTLSHQPHEMGVRAADTLLKKLKGLPVHSQEARWNLNQKESTGAP